MPELQEILNRNKMEKNPVYDRHFIMASVRLAYDVAEPNAHVLKFVVIHVEYILHLLHGTIYHCCKQFPPASLRCRVLKSEP
jgi:hypothetical protein